MSGAVDNCEGGGDEDNDGDIAGENGDCDDDVIGAARVEVAAAMAKTCEYDCECSSRAVGERT
jgi:hypothetical protein